jgi:hypothetical protein
MTCFIWNVRSHFPKRKGVENRSKDNSYKNYEKYGADVLTGF